GHSVSIASNGQEALDALAREPFDVVLMDIQMPVLDGVEACRIIRAAERENGPRQRIVAMTAHAMAGDREAYIGAGMDDYVAKPVERAALFAAVERPPVPAP